MPELRIYETSPTLEVAFAETEKGEAKERTLGQIGHPVGPDEKIDWENCGCVADGDGIRVTLPTKKK